jgi:hypothetical protein
MRYSRFGGTRSFEERTTEPRINQPFDLETWLAKPVTYFALAFEDKVTTQCGTVIGTITSSKIIPANKHQMRHIEVQGTNGATYYTRYAEVKGNLVMLKKRIRRGKEELAQQARQKRKVIKYNYGRNYGKFLWS